MTSDGACDQEAAGEIQDVQLIGGLGGGFPLRALLILLR